MSNTYGHSSSSVEAISPVVEQQHIRYTNFTTIVIFFADIRYFGHLQMPILIYAHIMALADADTQCFSKRTFTG